MSLPPVPPAGRCPRCGASWSFVSRQPAGGPWSFVTGQWLVKEPSGVAHLWKEWRAIREDGAPPPLKRCPRCKEKLAA